MSMSFEIGLMISGLTLEIISFYSLNSTVAIIFGITMILCGIIITTVQEEEKDNEITELKKEIRELKKKIK